MHGGMVAQRARRAGSVAAAGYRLLDAVMQRISAAFEPRARMVRRRRRALRWGAIFTAACLFWVSVTALLASWPTPVWVLLITGLTAAGAAGPATLLLLRYRWLRSVPLPAPRPGGHRLPPPGSAARPAMTALGSAERGLSSLLGVLRRARLLPDTELADLTAVADRAAATLAVTAGEVVSLEHAVAYAPESGRYLRPTIDAFAAQLAAGVRQYNQMVTAAAQLVAATDGGAAPANSPMAQRQYRDELIGATERLLGWAQAFDELGRVVAV